MVQSPIAVEALERPMGYASLEDRKAVGAHYTPRALSDFVAHKILEFWVPQSRDAKVRVLDPAIGEGELLLSLIGGLTKLGFSNIECVGFDTDRNAIELALSRINKAFPAVSVHLQEANFLEFALTYGAGSLFSQGFEFFDLSIANPPYVRTQVMGTKKSQQLALQFGFSGRVDLYYAFINGIATLMKPNGVAGIIVSNRFMTTESGRDVRKSIIDKFDVLHVWDLGDTRLFEAAVLPAVLLVRGKDRAMQPAETKFTSIYSTKNANAPIRCSNTIDALGRNGVVELPDGQRYVVQQGKLEHGERPDGIWRIATEQSEEWLAVVKSHTHCTFGEIGEIKVGIKTTADKVFIRSDWDDMPLEERPELLRPLITHHVARRFKAQQPDKPLRVLYTHQVKNGKRIAIDLSEFPRTARYLNRHRARLEGRKYVLDAGRRWFEIWVPQDPAAWSQPKVVFRDISEKPTFWLDLSGSIVNGDCYWVVCNNPQQLDLLWLMLGVGNSSFIEAFYDRRFRNKLYAGRRRFMTQYVRQFPLPNPETEAAREIIWLAKEIYRLTPAQETRPLEDELDHLVWQVFGLF